MKKFVRESLNEKSDKEIRNKMGDYFKWDKSQKGLDSAGHKYGSKESQYDKDGFQKIDWGTDEDKYVDNDIATKEILKIVKEAEYYMSNRAYKIFIESLKEIVNDL